MNQDQQTVGLTGEGLAVKFLRRKGYKIIARNFSTRFGEIDIIAQEQKVTVFIEVKTRSSAEFGLPQEAIKAEKIKHLWRVAQFYINHHANPDGNFRFDIVSIILGQPTQIQLIKEAF